MKDATKALRALSAAWRSWEVWGFTPSACSLSKECSGARLLKQTLIVPRPFGASPSLMVVWQPAPACTLLALSHGAVSAHLCPQDRQTLSNTSSTAHYSHSQGFLQHKYKHNVIKGKQYCQHAIIESQNVLGWKGP